MKNLKTSYARSLIEASLDPLVTISAEGKIMDVNSATEKVTGVPRQQLIGSDFSTYFTDPQKARDGYRLAFSQGKVTDYPLAICHTSGQITEVMYNASVYRDEKGDVAGIFAAARDVTALKKAQTELEAAILHMQLIREMTDLLQSCQKMDEAYPIIKAALVRLFADSVGGLYMLDAAGNSLVLADAWGSGESELEAVFTPDECWGMRRGCIHMARVGQSINPVCSHVKPGTSPYLCIPLLAHSRALGLIYIEHRFTSGHPEDIQRELSIAEAAADSARLALANLSLREELHELSIRDPLTGLFNRRFLEEVLDRELLRMSRCGKMLAVAMVDIDHFKIFNDNYGHDAGDEVLKKTAQLMNGFREGSDMVCRFGGEEFVVVTTEIQPDKILQRLDALRVAIESLSLKFGNHQLPQVTVSIGVAIYPVHGGTRLDLLTRADQALYVAKEAGRNRLVVADEEADVG
ncbi:diguanylate cyclase [Methylomonas sp. ZR1]|uniref:sensor domain-containing diguanylate cyclase n=1 Tax=unclassified Methylomonas TaxID=2608980 RepID=UPI001492052B|nr:diguanylate cyclase [Methylomonas sp. ZR1]NOV31910.1 diguanylate cyclase [Methylomonas sp. ZR1]